MNGAHKQRGAESKCEQNTAAADESPIARPSLPVTGPPSQR